MPSRPPQCVEIGEPQSGVTEVVVLPAELREDMLSRFPDHRTPLYGGSVFSVLPPSPGAAREQGETVRSVPKVLVTSRPPRHSLDYVDQLIGDDSEGRAPGGVLLEFRTDPWRARGVDVVHLTDVTTVIGGSHTPERARVRRAKRFAKLLRRRRIALVSTIHCEHTVQSPTRSEAILDDAAASVIALNTATTANGRAALVIGHSHLRDRFLGFPREGCTRGRVLITSSTTLHPAYERALKVFGIAALAGWTLRIAGGVPLELEDSYRRTIADHIETISLRNELLSDAARVAEISQAEIVVIAATETYEAQSILLLALSLDRPVLVEDTVHTRSLAEEVGVSWVRRHPGPLTAHALEAALTGLRADPPTGRPDLDSRDPNAISAQYTAVYRAAATGR